MEYFSRLLALQFQKGGVEYHMKCGRAGIQCLMFADDLLVFSRATSKSMEGLRDVLQEFHLTTGLSVNPSKSHAYFSKLDRSSAQFLLDILHIQFGEFPVSYLGLPLTGSIWSSETKQKLYGKLQAKLKVWNSRHLSHPAKVQIVNTILLGITGYWSSAIVLPKNVYDEVTTICRNFLWGHQKGQRKVVPISWETLCFSKAAGGAGIRDPRLWGQALLSKHLWEVQQEQDSLWIKWLHGYYLRGKDIWHCKANSNHSYLWKTMMGIRDKMGKSLLQLEVNGKACPTRASTRRSIPLEGACLTTRSYEVQSEADHLATIGRPCLGCISHSLPTAEAISPFYHVFPS
jgi:hypothetical protein